MNVGLNYVNLQEFVKGNFFFRVDDKRSSRPITL